MTKPTKPARPLKLLRALFKAQCEALEVPATSSTRRTDGAIEETTAYAASDDSLRVARAVLHRNRILPTPAGTRMRAGEHGRPILEVAVSLLHVDSGQELVRTFDVEVSAQYGANAAALSGYATALRLLLGLPRAPESTTVAAVEHEPELPTATRVRVEPPLPIDEPRATERVVVPAPRLAQRVADRVRRSPPADDVQIETGDAEELRALCQRLGTELAARESTPSCHAGDPEAWRIAAGVPARGRLQLEELQAYARWLKRELAPPPDDSGAAWPAHEPSD